MRCKGGSIFWKEGNREVEWVSPIRFSRHRAAIIDRQSNSPSIMIHSIFPAKLNGRKEPLVINFNDEEDLKPMPFLVSRTSNILPHFQQNIELLGVEEGQRLAVQHGLGGSTVITVLTNHTLVSKPTTVAVSNLYWIFCFFKESVGWLSRLFLVFRNWRRTDSKFIILPSMRMDICKKSSKEISIVRKKCWRS